MSYKCSVISSRLLTCVHKNGEHVHIREIKYMDEIQELISIREWFYELRILVSSDI